MKILIGPNLLAALGSDDAAYAVEEFANRHGGDPVHAADILEDIVSNWANDHRRFPEPLTFDALLSEASEGMAEAHAYDEEFAREMY
jgi:hypothetical protein